MPTKTSIPPHIKSKRQLKIWERQQKENAAKRMNRDLYVNQSPFRYAERVYKSRIISQCDLDNVIDFSDINNNAVHLQENIVEVNLKHDLRELSSQFGVSDPQWKQRWSKAYVLKHVPGLIVIPDAFTPEAQRKLVKHCIKDYAKPPHTSNLNGHYHIPANGIWPLHEKQKLGLLKPGDPNFYVPIKMSELHEQNAIYNDDNDDAASIASSMYASTIDQQHPKNRLLSPTQLLLKQRWVTLGYQYHWGTKKYDLDHPIPIPEDISELTKAVALATDDVGYEQGSQPWKNNYCGASFKPEAGIINFYQLQSMLMGHVDQSEINMDAPLISLSLGHSCVYLIGGNTTDTKPIPLKLNSGDIIVMTAIARRAFHGVPRILEGTLPEYLSPTEQFEDDQEWSLYGEYIKTTRINLNIRQVFKD